MEHEGNREGLRERRRTPGSWVLGAAAKPACDRLDAALAGGRDAAAIMVRMRRLDLLNAAHGRAVGDAVLREANARLAGIAGADAVTRLDGGNFVVTIEGDREQALAVARTMAEALAGPLVRGVAIGVRVGVAARDCDESAAELLIRAGEALAAASAGAPALAECGRAASLDALAVDLHHAIGRNEIDILFQPQVSIADDRIVGAEALARWRHPRLGALGADALFAAAERADLGLALSERIQMLSLAQGAAWPAALSALRLSINLTATDVMREGFAAALLARIAASGFPVERVTLELTETAPLADARVAARSLAACRAAGCRVAIDDFGAGYSSLAYVRALPLDYIKLDKSLVEDIAFDERDARLVTATIAVATAMGLGVIAEGVEATGQRDLLAQAGCDQYQGFLCAPPLDAAALARLVEDR